MAGRAVWTEAHEQQHEKFWAPLKKNLNDQLHEDIYRIYKKSLFCDWIVKSGDRTLKLNRCILIARSNRLYNLLIGSFQDGSAPTRKQIECLCRFLPKLYCGLDIEKEETLLLSELDFLRPKKATTPDSEGFITADSSPSDCPKHEFYDAKEHLETENTYLSQELEEQDQLSYLFRNISVKSRDSNAKSGKANKTKVKSTKVPILKRLSINKNSLSDMDSGLETASSETSGMDLSDPLQSPYDLETLSSKERRIVNEHDSSSSDTPDDFEDLGKNVKTDLIVTQTKEQKQKQNEEIVIMESSSVSSETGSWESVFPKVSSFALKQYNTCDSTTDNNLQSKKSVGTSNGHGNHYFIDASSLHDEDEFCSISSNTSESCNPLNKLTKLKVNDQTDSQKYEIAEFQKEIKVTENSHEVASTSNACSILQISEEIKPNMEQNFNEKSRDSENESSPEGISKNLPDPSGQFPIQKSFSNHVYGHSSYIEPQICSKSLPDTKYFTDICLVDICDTSTPPSSLLPIEDSKNPRNFLRSNTFDIESNDDQVALRQNNERRQGSLIFQNSIQQFSTHSLGIEEVLPTTPHNSIIQLADSRIVDQANILESLFDKSKPKEVTETLEILNEDEDNELSSSSPNEIESTEELLDLKPIKREESVPIISGGVSSQDFKQEIRIDSPLIKRKLESTPIVSGGAVIMDDPETKVEKPQKPIVTAAWVVDMKPEPNDTKKETEIPQKSNHKSSLGFYVDLKDIITEPVATKSKQTTQQNESSDSADKRNIFSMVIDFEAPKKSMPSRLSNSLFSKKPNISKTESQNSQMCKSANSSFEKSNTQLSANATNLSKQNSKTSNSSTSLNKENSPKTSSTNLVSDNPQPSQILTTNIKNENPEISINTPSNANLENEISADKKNGNSEENSNSKSVYMFIESETTVVKRRRSSNNNSRSHNRHSWNSSGGESDTSTLCHQRTYSLSGNEDFGPRPVIQENEILSSSSKGKLLESSSSDENKDTSSVTENEDQHQNIKKMEIIAENNSPSSFVRLSDLDKPLPKVTTTEPSSLIPTRMSRSIPETSWIENKLLMSRSTGCRASSSRLYPHLSTSTPSNLFMTHRDRAKSPGVDTDEMVSELSDLSSMHSSTALEVSTEETSHSSSYQPHHSADRLGHDLLRMFLEEISPDVTVEVSGRRLKAHKCILSSRCQYFAAMLSGGWVESAGNVISLQGFSYQAVHFALCHIYSGAADIPESISLVELATLADMLGLEGLKEVVAYTLKLKHCHLFHKPCSVCVVGVLECLPLAAAYGLDDLYRKSLRWITRYFVRVWPTRAFAVLPRELMEKCYQQHVVHMSADNVLETTLCCDKLLATLPSVRWAEVVHDLTAQLAEACQSYITGHYSSMLASASFLSLGKELSWNISRLEDGLFRAAEKLSPEQACRSYSRAHRLLTLLESGDESWSPNFVDFVRAILHRIEDCVVRQAVRVSYTSAWPRLDSILRSRIQELCCLPLDRPRVARQPRSTSGSRNLDLRQVRLAMQQHTRRAQSNDSRPATARSVKPPPKPSSDPPRPRTWPAQVNNKKIISSSESSRTSSPAMKRNPKAPLKAPLKKEVNLNNDMSLDSLASPVHTKNRASAASATKKSETKVFSDSLTSAKSDKKQIKPKVDSRRTTQVNKKSNVLKSNVQKTGDKPNLSKSLPAMNKENRTQKQQSKSGSSSSTQHSPSALLRNKTSTNNSSSSGTNMSPYSGSPSLRRSLLLAARAPQTPIKPVSPATNKRIARLQASHSVTSPTKSSAAKCVTNSINNANTTIRNKTTTTQRHYKQTPKATKKQIDKCEKSERIEKTVERSGTFCLDEPSMLNKSEAK